MNKKPVVLIIEDEPQLVELLKSKLRDNEIEVLSSDSVPTAVQLLSNQRFDCVVLDMQLRDGSGEQVIATMRREKKAFNYETPILVISAHLSPDLIRRIRPEISGALVKPFQREIFAAKVQSLCLGIPGAGFGKAA